MLQWIQNSCLGCFLGAYLRYIALSSGFHYCYWEVKQSLYVLLLRRKSITNSIWGRYMAQQVKSSPAMPGSSLSYPTLFHFLSAIWDSNQMYIRSFQRSFFFIFFHISSGSFLLTNFIILRCFQFPIKPTIETYSTCFLMSYLVSFQIKQAYLYCLSIFQAIFFSISLDIVNIAFL